MWTDNLPQTDGAHEALPFDELNSCHQDELREQLGRVIPQDTTLLISGETGTGKSRLARWIHERSPRREQPLVIVDCAALSPQLVESEIFGHVQGAFTGADSNRTGRLAAAGRGTLLLDEIGALPIGLQGKLLRVMDDKLFEPVGSDVLLPLLARVIVISSVPLEHEVEAGRFRADLFYRLNVVSFQLAPLRMQPAMVGPLAKEFLAEFAARHGALVREFSPEALAVLMRHSWPGNIRELRNTIERVVAIATGPRIRREDLPENLRHLAAETVAGPRRDCAWAPPHLGNGHLTLSQGAEQVEMHRIREALQRNRFNRVRTAAELGISRMSLYKKLHKYKLFDIA